MMQQIVEIPLWAFGIVILVIAGTMFHSNYFWRTKVMKEEYDISNLENLPAAIMTSIGIAFFLPYVLSGAI